MKTIFTITLNPALDKSSSTDHVMAEHKLRCDIPKFDPGGGGINVARAIKKLGGEATAVYPYGGPSGAVLKQLLEKEGMKQIAIECKNWTRENFVLVEKSSNRQYRFTLPGLELYESEWKKCLQVIELQAENIDYIVASGSMPPGVPEDFYARLAKISKEKNAKLVLDTSGEALKLAVKEGIYLLKPNLKELSDLVGEELKNIKQQEEAAMEIVRQGHIEIMVVSLGASGAFMATRDEIHHVAAPSVAKKSTVGAGDSMVGGIVYALSIGWSHQQALQFGVASGTAATMSEGTELCKREDVDDLFQWISKATQKQVMS